MIAIAVGFRTEVLNHKFLAAKAVVTGSAALYLQLALLGRASVPWNRLLLFHRPLFRLFTGGPIFGSDDAVNSMHRYRAIWLFFDAYANWIMAVEIFMIFAAFGWIVGKSNRRCHRPLLLFLLISWTLWFGYSTFSYWSMLMVDSIDQPRFRPYLGHFMLRFFAAIVGWLLRGIWSPARSSDPVRVD
jgi:hypothetical protein